MKNSPQRRRSGASPLVFDSHDLLPNSNNRLCLSNRKPDNAPGRRRDLGECLRVSGRPSGPRSMEYRIETRKNRGSMGSRNRDRRRLLDLLRSRDFDGAIGEWCILRFYGGDMYDTVEGQYFDLAAEEIKFTIIPEPAVVSSLAGFALAPGGIFRLRRR